MKRSCSLLVALAFLLGACASEGVAAPGDRTTAAPETDGPAATLQTASPRPRATATPTAKPTARPTARPTPRPTPTPTPIFGAEPTGPIQIAQVVSVTDGDTIRVLIGGQEYPVRYIGIDTPEIHSGVEWMGREASAANAELVSGGEVILEKDVSETDRYGRLLRYVWVDQGGGALLLVNLELLRRGLAQVTTYPPDVKYVDSLYLGVQQEAREAGIGLWGAPPTPAPAAPVPVAPGGNCEPSYPDVCIPIGSADLDCGDMEARRFTVLWNVANPDPHRFDGDADGLGCES